MSWSLNLLTAVHPSDEPIKASTALTYGDDCEINHEVGRVMDVLAELGLLLDDRPDVLGTWIDERLAAVHPTIRAEAQVLIDILRHGGQRRTPHKEGTIRQKIDYIARFLTDVSTDTDHTTLARHAHRTGDPGASAARGMPGRRGASGLTHAATNQASSLLRPAPPPDRAEGPA